MTIRQQYYTSCRNAETGKTGFQVRAVTPGISRRAEQALQRLIAYRPPASADPQAPETHPISLRYYTPARDEALLICAQSNGPDEFGRPGNFFAHSLVGPPEAFNDPLPPIFYWRSPFWVQRDNGGKSRLPELSSLAAAAPVAFNYDGLWAFLTGQRREWLYRLLCAVLDHPRSGRRIIIVDDADSVAAWIALLTMALPYQHRPWLTFATYHHDPYSVPFLVTGTTPDSTFRFTADEYRSYFVLHTAEGRISAAPESAFARFVCDHLTPDRYENAVLDFFVLLRRRDPASTSPDPARLDLLTRFYQLGLPDSPLLPSEEVAAIAGTIIREVAALPRLDPADAGDLRTAWDILAGELAESGRPELLPDFQLALERLRQDDPGFASTSRRACEVLARLLDRPAAAPVRPLAGLLSALYPLEALQAAMRGPDLLGPLVERVGEDPARLLAFWECCGPLLTFDEATLGLLAPVFARTLVAAHRQATPDPLLIPAEVDRLLKAMLRTQKTIGYVTRLVTDFHQRYPTSPILAWVYYAWVEGAALADRAAVREVYSAIDPTIITYELKRDLFKRLVSPSDLGAILGDWLAHLHPMHREAMAGEALRFCWEQAEIDRAALSATLLARPEVTAALDIAWQARLVEAALPVIEAAEPDKAALALYRRLLSREDAPLTPAARAALEGVVLLSAGELHENTVPLLNRRLSAADEATYRAEAGRLLRRLFAAGGSTADHGLLIAALYVEEHRAIFWELYWAELRRRLLEAGELPAVLRALDFWFAHSQRLHATYPLLLPAFFLTLPERIAVLKADKAYPRVARELEDALRDLTWYPLVERHFPEAGRSRGFLKGLFER
ncbi:MAG: hypothetical protein HPY64_03570 [Anaerolineae bacterium]|nr:hypothetical protein [Anaerolineae bacterium]